MNDSSSPASNRKAEDPNLPPTPEFISSPDTVDKWIWVYFTAITIFTLAMLPLRVWLLNNPEIYALAIGGYTSAIVGGAQAAAGGTAAWIIVALALIGAMKSIPLWWLMGTKWGVGYLSLMMESSKRTRKWVGRLENLSPRLLLGIVFVSYIPFMPTLFVANLLAAIRGCRLRTVLAVNAIGVICRNSTFAYLGYRFGEPVIAVVDQINRYALWITIALVVIAVWSATRKKPAS